MKQRDVGDIIASVFPGICSHVHAHCLRFEWRSPRESQGGCWSQTGSVPTLPLISCVILNISLKIVNFVSVSMCVYEHACVCECGHAFCMCVNVRMCVYVCIHGYVCVWMWVRVPPTMHVQLWKVRSLLPPGIELKRTLVASWAFNSGGNHLSASNLLFFRVSP